MKKSILVAFLAGLSCLPASGEESWKTFTASDKNYSIQLPGKPNLVSDGDTYFVRVDLVSPERTFQVQRIATKSPRKPSELESTQSGFLKFCEKNKGTVLSHDLKPFKGFPASSVVYEMDGQHVESLSVATPKYLFNISMSRSTTGPDFSAKERALFPGSFSVKDTP